jgi:hypothetical protein
MEFCKADIGRYNEALTPVVFSSGDTISSLLSKANISLSGTEMVVTLHGVRQELNSVAVNGETYLIVENLKNGSH